MTESEARAAAERLLLASSENNNSSWSLKFVSATRDKIRDGEWVVLFDQSSSEGSLIDGPVVILVNDLTGLAVHLDQSIAARFPKSGERH